MSGEHARVVELVEAGQYGGAVVHIGDMSASVSTP